MLKTLPDECSSSDDCNAGETCAYMIGGEYIGYKHYRNGWQQSVSKDESVNRCTASDRCGKYFCGEYVATSSDIIGNNIDV